MTKRELVRELTAVRNRLDQSTRAHGELLHGLGQQMLSAVQELRSCVRRITEAGAEGEALRRENARLLAERVELMRQLAVEATQAEGERQ